MDENDKRHHVFSQDVNHYLHDITGEHFTSKDFRTWSGTVLAVEKAEDAFREIEGNPRKKPEATIVRKVAVELGNTASICREYYIHPQVLRSVCCREWNLYSKYKRRAPALKKWLNKNELLTLAILEHPSE